MHVSDYQKANPDYLRSQFPREISGWHKFSKREQDQLIQWELEKLARDGYTENEDGSFTKKD